MLRIKKTPAKQVGHQERILAIMARYIRDWKDGSEYFTVADWMK